MQDSFNGWLGVVILLVIAIVILGRRGAHFEYNANDLTARTCMDCGQIQVWAHEGWKPIGITREPGCECHKAAQR